MNVLELRVAPAHLVYETIEQLCQETCDLLLLDQLLS